METAILYGVGKKLRNDYLNGKVAEDAMIAAYNKNKREADMFCAYAYRNWELAKMQREIHNPLLREKVQKSLFVRRHGNSISVPQNKLNLEKLDGFMEDACGIGLRKVIRKMDKLSKKEKDPEVKLLTLLLETEFANLSAKRHHGRLRAKIYERKMRLIYQMANYLEKLGWNYGVSDEIGKNANYLVYVYLPNNVQLCWHCNEYQVYGRYPAIDATWDGQKCMTMTKILTYIEKKYSNILLIV